MKNMPAIARNLSATRHLYRVDVVARVESEDDIRFWQATVKEVRPSLKVKFIPAEISESNARQRGKTLCLKLIDCLDKHLIICVDSDFDKFLNPDLLQASKHILQTHTYSWENHHCQATNLQSKWNELQCGSFDFSQFILDFSRLLYPAVLCILTAKINGLKASPLIQ